MDKKIDFGTMKVSTLFRKLLLPTILGMVFSAVFIITDGIFVGKGIGSDALAAVNITAPLFMVNTGIALMFGIGASVVASVYLAQKKTDAARVNITQAMFVMSFSIILLSGISFCFIDKLAVGLGSSERLLPLAREYMQWFLPFFVFSSILNAGMFYVRLDGSPNYAMICNVIPAILNIILDYVFIFELDWGLFGAALATSLGYIIGAAMILYYLYDKKRTVHFYPLLKCLSNMKVLARNSIYICKLGISSFLCEAAIAIMMFTGNYVFIRHLGEDGVAAYSIACYFFPIIFMAYNAIAQSAQPILSYNYGIERSDRVKSAFILALSTAVVFGSITFVLTYIFSHEIVGLFIDSQYPAYNIAVKGMPLFASGYAFFGANLVCIGYYQSLEQDKTATFITIMRGFIFINLCFLVLPQFFGNEGIWLAVPMAEALTLATIIITRIFLNKEKLKYKISSI